MKHSRKHIFTELPSGYTRFAVYRMDEEHMDLLRELSRLELIIVTLSFLAGLLFRPLSTLSQKNVSASPLFRMVLIPVGIFLYLFLHEITHIAVMKLFGSGSVKVEKGPGVTATGSDDYFDAFSFIMVSLAPCVVYGVVLALVCLLVPAGWFWTVYPMLMINFSGSVSDFYAVHIMRKAPTGSLVQDRGLELSIYSPAANENGGNPEGECK